MYICIRETASYHNPKGKAKILLFLNFSLRIELGNDDVMYTMTLLEFS